MIKVECQDPLLLKSLLSLFEQKKIISSVNPSNYFNLIKVEHSYKSISLNVDNKKFNFLEPVNLNELIKMIQAHLTDYCISFDHFDYLPYQRIILRNKKKIFLTEIQNNILTTLFLNKEGLNKDEVYKLIWPMDKLISINKLDTHLTNLKTQISSELGVEISFRSKEKNLKLIIN